MQATRRRIWIAFVHLRADIGDRGEFDTWSYAEDRRGLLRDLTGVPVKRYVLIRNVTHFVLFEKPRFEFFNKVVNFLKEQP